MSAKKRGRSGGLLQHIANHVGAPSSGRAIGLFKNAGLSSFGEASATSDASLADMRANARQVSSRTESATEEEEISGEALEAKRREGIKTLIDFISGVSVDRGTNERGAVALLNAKTGVLRYLYDSAAGRGNNGEFIFKVGVRAGEFIVAYAHSHPKEKASRKEDEKKIDALNDAHNPNDIAELVGGMKERDPAGIGSVSIIKGPSGGVDIEPKGIY